MRHRLRRPVRILVASMLVAALGLATVAPVAAARHAGCAAAESGWAEYAAAEAATLIWPSVVDQSPWGGDLNAFIATIEGLDLNGDGDLCLKRIAGFHENSPWHGVIFNYLVDNTANAADG
ncbi:MAG TPA: hypothetical protein VFX65_02565 [Candidatus Limnocylindrales bacterium]|nr:hypothetical protein [Candidatus Limnocylindrales bacterium]